MLLRLSVRDIVLIDRLDLEFELGLSVLTGETGAGKSILLDALGLALGARSDAALLRKGCKQGSVAAVFECTPDHPARVILEEHSIDIDDTLILRRVLTDDGRSRAFVNDQPVAVALLRRLGECLVEIHGQHDERGLLNVAGHRVILDAFGDAHAALQFCRAAFEDAQSAEQAVGLAESALDAALAERDYLKHSFDELESLDSRAGEEAELAETRQLLRQGEKLREAITEAATALGDDSGIDARIRTAERTLRRVAERSLGRLDNVLDALARAAAEATEAMALVDQLGSDLDLDPRRLDQVEERLFALREVARKHRVDVDMLHVLRDGFGEKLSAVESGEEQLSALRKKATSARRKFVTRAKALGKRRQDAAKRLDLAVARELAPLKLDRALFQTRLDLLPEAKWSADGAERAAFEVATNPGATPGPLNRIASGGELARFMLAIKVALAGTRTASTLVFDEVDRGVGGAVADRVGARLARLAKDTQVLVVTHSPQVAARAAHHWHVIKDESDDGARTRVVELDETARQEEIARMLAGAKVTPEARAAAGSLIDAAQP